MKIIGLVPFRNEAWILSACLSSLLPVVDEIIALDDGSTDESTEIVKSYGGHVVRQDRRPESGWAEFNIREELLRVGRERSGTHFVCLDADEAIVSGSKIRPLIERLAPQQKLSAQWMALWKTIGKYRSDHSIWSNLFIDFAFRDDGQASHSFAWLGVGRTPRMSASAATIRVEPSTSCVLHFQFAAWNRFQVKQAWYRCSELVKTPGTAREINHKYAMTLEDSKTRLRDVPRTWWEGLDIPPALEQGPVGWHLEAVEALFDQHGTEFFEPLQIWHVPELRSHFVRTIGRQPKSEPTHPLTVVYWSSRLRKAIYSRLGYPKGASQGDGGKRQ